MPLRLQSLPEQTDDWPDWLERQIVGTDLSDLIHELSVFGAAKEAVAPVPASLADVFGPAYEDVLRDGLSQASPDQIQILIERPRLLLVLQEEALVGGSQYWIDRCQAAHEDLEFEFDETGSDAVQPGSATVATGDESTEPNRRTRISRTALVLLSLAAVLFVAVMLFLRPSAQDAEWGFHDDSVFVAGSPDDYFRSLAGAANEWFDERPQTAEELMARLAEFSSGCQRVIDMEHDNLTDLQWQWLVNRCELWKDQIDTLNRRLAADSTRFAQTLSQADQTIERIVEALKDQAESVG
ncbi:hypothetical protein Enr13x_20850 [Stieleria neptunia]|uniref:Uncharacterized protein n=1 Tax=Stieleria neptunia TaxID=2527979 RepID=A0A518HN43_9BACT|nr:hypothetical protein [Stieleria neptunia]QDV42240.1 hypothetical protein Enr13x_20850 [Stieleria neptunia]